MKVQLIVEEILRTGWMKLSQETAILRVIGAGSGFSAAEFKALVRLQKALQSGSVLVGERKQCVNVMEQLVRDAAVEEIALRDLDEEDIADVGDVVAYALNRLPPLYATTQEGVQYHLTQAKKKLWATIQEKVSEAIDQSLAEPDSRPGSMPLGKDSAQATVSRIVGRYYGDQ